MIPVPVVLLVAVLVRTVAIIADVLRSVAEFASRVVSHACGSVSTIDVRDCVMSLVTDRGVISLVPGSCRADIRALACVERNALQNVAFVIMMRSQKFFLEVKMSLKPDLWN